MAMSKEAVVVEIRMQSRECANIDDSNVVDKHKESGTISAMAEGIVASRPAPVAPGKTESTVDFALGRVVGNVVLLTEVSKVN